MASFLQPMDGRHWGSATLLVDDGLWLLHTVVVSAKAHEVSFFFEVRLAASGSVGYVKAIVGSIPACSFWA